MYKRQTVEWTLPSGVTEYEVSWKDKQISEHIRLIEENIYQNRYETTFSFLDSAKNQKFTIKVSCEKYGTIYQGKDKLTILTPILDAIVIPVIILIIIVAVALYCVTQLLGRVRETTSMESAVMECT